MQLRLDPARLAPGADAFAARAEDMAARRATIEASVEVLLDGWRGEAAHRFTELWEQWRDHADEVIEGLAVSASALRHTGHDVVATDAEAAEGVARVAGRLG